MPRHWVLAVRLISSKNYRVKRLAKTLNVKEKNAERILNKFDREQKEFLKRPLAKKTLLPMSLISSLIVTMSKIRDGQRK